MAMRTVTSRVLMYVIPVIVISTIINIPKFLELELIQEISIDEKNLTSHTISYTLSDLRKTPDYIRYDSGV